MEHKMFVHELKLTGEGEFAKRFNYVSDLFKKYSESNSDEDWKAFSEAKYCLEQGLPLPTIIN